MKNPGVYRGSKDIDIAIIWHTIAVSMWQYSTEKNINCSADWKKHFSEWFWYCNKLIVLIIWQLSFLSLWFYHDICFVSSFFSLPFIWFGFMVFNATQQYFSYIVAVNFIGGWNGRIPEKTTDLPQVTDKLDHLMLCTSPWVGFESTTSMVIGTDCICSCKSNYHTITATTVPLPYINFIFA